MQRFRKWLPVGVFLVGIISIVLGVAALAGWPAAQIVLGIVLVALVVQEVYS